MRALAGRMLGEEAAPPAPSARHQVDDIRCQLKREQGLPFLNVLSRALVEDMCRQGNSPWRNRTYTPWITLGLFLSQVLSDDQCCDEAVDRFQKARGQRISALLNRLKWLGGGVACGLLRGRCAAPRWGALGWGAGWGALGWATPGWATPGWAARGSVTRGPSGRGAERGWVGPAAGPTPSGCCGGTSSGRGRGSTGTG